MTILQYKGPFPDIQKLAKEGKLKIDITPSLKELYCSKETLQDIYNWQIGQFNETLMQELCGMEKKEFKVGHFAKVLDNRGLPGLDTGELYRVTQIDGCIHLTLDGKEIGDKVALHEDCLEPINFEVGMTCKLDPKWKGWEKSETTKEDFRRNKDLEFKILERVEYKDTTYWNVDPSFDCQYGLVSTALESQIMPVLNPNTNPICTCSSFDLAWNGCKCGYIQWERENAPRR